MAQREAIEQFRRKYHEGLQCHSFDCTIEDDIEKLAKTCKTVSFFNDIQLLVVKNAFISKETAESFFQSMTPTTIATLRDLIILTSANEDEKGLQKKHKKLTQLLLKGKPATYFPLPSDRELPQWIQHECTRQGAIITPEAARALAHATGNDTWSIAQELQKLIAFAGNQTITLQDVSFLVQGTIEGNVFALTDALASGDRLKASALLFRELSIGQDPAHLLGLLAWQSRALLSVHDLAQRGTSAQEIARITKLHPFMVGKVMKNILHHNLVALKHSHEALATLDRKMKSGESDLVHELYAFLLSYAST